MLLPHKALREVENLKGVDCLDYLEPKSRIVGKTLVLFYLQFTGSIETTQYTILPLESLQSAKRQFNPNSLITTPNIKLI